MKPILRRVVRAAAATCFLVAMFAVLAEGQTTGSLLAQRRLEFRASRDMYEAASSAFSVVERSFSAALDDVARARRSGDEDALERAFALALDRSAPLADQQLRVDEARAALVSTRLALIDMLAIRLEELVAEMDAATSSVHRAQLDAVWRDLFNELETLEAEAGDTFRLDPVVLPGISFDPRDGPEEILQKAQILERQASVADTVIQDTDRQIEALEDRLRIRRQREDFLAAADRFDDTRVPVVSGSNARETTPVADSTGVALPALTLEERIELLRQHRADLETYRDQLLLRAEQFRGRIRTVT